MMLTMMPFCDVNRAADKTLLVLAVVLGNLHASELDIEIYTSSDLGPALLAGNCREVKTILLSKLPNTCNTIGGA